MAKTGRIFNIQHFSVHDGPGIRTVVFFKGCPLRCAWCANPESQIRDIQLGWTKGECIGCKNCVQKLSNLGCRFESQALEKAPELFWDSNHSLTDEEVGQVRRICPSNALHAIGRDAGIDEILREVEKDSAFYAQSGGGITLSGGEPLLQHEFVTELLHQAGKRHIHRAIETTGLCRYESFRQVAGELDFLLIDVKIWTPSLHEKWTGFSNEVILENLVHIRRDFPELPILVRTPVIPGVNDNENELRPIADFVKTLGGNTSHELLKYHRLGEPKYASLHRRYELSDRSLSDERFSELKKICKEIS